MSRDVENRILNAKLPANAKLLLMLFARMCTPKNPLFSVNTAELAERMHLSRATIRKLVKHIEQAGLIQFELVFNKRERLYRFAWQRNHVVMPAKAGIQKNLTASSGPRDDNMGLDAGLRQHDSKSAFTPPEPKDLRLMSKLPEEIQALVQVICKTSQSFPEFTSRILPVIRPSGFTLDKQGEIVRQ